MEVEPSRILLVEDDPLNVELFQLALESYNFVNQIDILDDGAQALQYLLGEEGSLPNRPLPDLVLLDLKLPKINGFQVLQAIRAHPRTRDLVVVILAASKDDKELNACYALGVSQCVTKPLGFEKFISIVRQIGWCWVLLKTPPLLPPEF
ncbi:response regulator [Gloeocapsopsis dulcis]|uniref:Two-component system response regulator n=1 Tax=Gloeocapsopsis dulcis AAB1 = 1H9 TaxID=1433147 RepID=A0A6N8G2E2_9CHRO|nr:response regulator [Gloeocapsopsis dulcis]MUL39052.1 two-component system response regulator [Gloeocapsopsis dulcis AAB1 = 1H9]WNN90712.1 response regulator [Gloeocapsopsis dulcis]